MDGNLLFSAARYPADRKRLHDIIILFPILLVNCFQGFLCTSTTFSRICTKKSFIFCWLLLLFFNTFCFLFFACFVGIRSSPIFREDVGRYIMLYIIWKNSIHAFWNQQGDLLSFPYRVERIFSHSHTAVYAFGIRRFSLRPDMRCPLFSVIV